MKITDVLNISKEDLSKLKYQMKDGETITLYSDEKVKCKLMKIDNRVYEVINSYGQKKFADSIKEMYLASFPWKCIK